MFPSFFYFFFFSHGETGEAVEKLIPRPSPPHRSVNECDPYNKIRLLPNVVLRSSYRVSDWMHFRLFVFKLIN